LASARTHRDSHLEAVTQSIAEAYCALMEAAELLGDIDRFKQWTAAIDLVG
jgi:hypothetical protein